MKAYSGSITTTYTCDSCGVETASGVLPANWVKFYLVKKVGLLEIDIEKDIGPVCMASSDPSVLAEIKNTLI